MPEHRVEMAQPSKVVLHSDVRFTVYGDEQKLGDLTISKGTIDWRPARRRSVHSLTWEQFARLMDKAR